MAVFLNRLIPKTMLNERNKLWKDMNSIYVSFKAWKTIIYGIYAYIVFLWIYRNMPKNDPWGGYDDGYLWGKRKGHEMGREVCKEL